MDAATAAEGYDEDAPVIEMIDVIDEALGKIKITLHYLVVVAVLFGLPPLLYGVIALEGLLSHFISAVGIAIIGCGIFPVSLFYVLKHLLSSNAELVSLYNEELTERPGDIRMEDRNWTKLAAKYFWNHSLCNPKTILLILFLSLIRSVSPRLYGRIVGDIRHNIQDFIGKNAIEILKHQLSRIHSESFEYLDEQVEPPTPHNDTLETID